MPLCPSLLRETYAIRFLQAGGELAALQERLGVAGLASVRRYQRFCEEQRKAEQRTQERPEKARPTPRSRRSKRHAVKSEDEGEAVTTCCEKSAALRADGGERRDRLFLPTPERAT
jgi:hypothetical protein